VKDVETFLARLFTDAALRVRFERDRAATLRAEGFDEALVASLAAIDVVGLELSGRVYAKKLAHHDARSARASASRGRVAKWWRRLVS
jgi:hypothetical protein